MKSIAIDCGDGVNQLKAGAAGLMDQMATMLSFVDRERHAHGCEAFIKAITSR
ncbi:MAG: hypothetical protein ACLU0O_08160 [Collinsella sp.]